MDVTNSFSINKKAIEDEGKAHLIVRFASLTDMTNFIQKNFDEGISARHKDSLDVISADREFVMGHIEHGQLRKFETT